MYVLHLYFNLISLPILAKLIGRHPLDTAHTPALGACVSLALSGVLLCHGFCPVILRGYFKGSLPHEATSDCLVSLHSQIVDNVFLLRASVALYACLTVLRLVS